MHWHQLWENMPQEIRPEQYTVKNMALYQRDIALFKNEKEILL